MKKVFLKISQKSQATPPLGFCFNRVEAYNFIKKEIATQVFSCEFCEILKNTFSTEHLPATASALNILVKM